MAVERKAKVLPNRLRLILYGLSAILGVSIIVYGYITYFPKFMAHIIATIGIVTALITPATFIHLDNRRRDRIDIMLPRLMDDIVESQEAGMTLIQALEESSKRSYGPITEELRQLVARVSWGVPLESAFKFFSERIGTRLSKQVTVLILEALRLGGDVRATMKSTADFVREILAVKAERESKLRPYVIVVYVCSLIFIAIVVIIYQNFLVSLFSDVAGSSTLGLSITLEEYKVILFDLAMIEAFFGGLVAGKLSKGSVLVGLKHVVILLIASSLILSLFLVDTTPPTVQMVGILPEKPIREQPVTILVQVSDPFPSSGVKNVTIYYTVDYWETTETLMMVYDTTRGLWWCQLFPSENAERLQFYIVAFDNDGNTALEDKKGKYFELCFS